MRKSKIFLAGHTGMVGSAIYNRFRAAGCNNIATRELNELDLRNQKEVNKFFRNEKPEFVIIAAARVGGIQANNIYRAEFIYDNLMIASNIINAAHQNNVEKLLFLGSSCIYPKYSDQPMKEEYLLTGELEPTNEPYAIAKIAGIKLCENYYRQYGRNFFSVMPTNLFGPHDNFNLESSHVLPALLRKTHEAKINGDPAITVWGSGAPKREFLFVNDLAEAIFFLMSKINADELYSKGISHLNIGTGEDISILELSEMIKEVVGFKGDINFDKSKPDGTPRKLLDVTRINQIGWKSSTILFEGIRSTYKWYIENINSGNIRL